MNGEFEAGERDATQWMSILKLETMSTDESDVEDGEEVLVVHPLPWLSETICDLKRALDQQIRMSKTPQAKRQMKKRLTGNDSTRSVPKELPSWALKRQH